MLNQQGLHVPSPGGADCAGIVFGRGSAPSHHGELLQGVFACGNRMVRGLVTLPCPLFKTWAEVTLTPTADQVTVNPAWKTKARRTVRLTLDMLGLPRVGGHLMLRGDVEVGRGLGSSTSDVTATVRAVLDATGGRLSPEQVATIAVRAEIAADPLMFDRMVLFAQREGVVVEDFHRPMPPIGVLGFSVADDEFDTLAFPLPDYTPWEAEAFRTLTGLLRRAAARRNVAALGRVATASAVLNQRFWPTPGFAELCAVAKDNGALGLQIAHTGTVAGLLWDPDDPRTEARAMDACLDLARLGISDVWYYTQDKGEG